MAADFPKMVMSSNTEHTHHIKLRSTQMEMPTTSNRHGEEDYDRKLKDAQDELERIQLQKEELARKKFELEDLMGRKQEFITRLAETAERLTSSITLIERELYEIRSEAEDLEQCRGCFAGHLDKLQKIRPEAWQPENLAEKMERATISLDVALDEYDQASNHFAGSRSGAIFGRGGKRTRKSSKIIGNSEFMVQLRNGLAFNLPILTLGTVAIIVWLMK